MNERWISADQIFDGQSLVAGMALRIENGCIAEIAKAPKSAQQIKGIITAGFVDLQVNGGGGEMLNSNQSPDAIRTIVAAHRRFGTVALMPTVITDRPEILEAAAATAIKVKDAAGVMGLHIEGPHISVARKGTHDPQYIRAMDDRTMAVVAKLRNAGVRVMITLAPEAVTVDQITKLSQMGAVVSIGHTDAKAEAVEAAIQAGASCATHLFNAMSPMQSRAPGAVGAVLNAGVHAGLICDGYHVDDAMIRLALRACAKQERLFIVSDAMATVGGPERFNLYGKEVRLEHGRLLNQEDTLAGAHLTQAQGVERLVGSIGTTLTQALKMAVSIPANVMGRPDLAHVQGRPITECLLLNDAGQMQGNLADVMQEMQPVDAAE